MNKLTLSAILLALLCLELQTANAVKPLFSDTEPLNMVLSTPLTRIYKEKKQKVRQYYESSLSYKTKAGESQKLNLKVRTRGNFRRLNCAHPPLRLNFVKKANKDNLFKGQNKLKLVGPCRSGDKFQDLIGLEYIVYKMWEQISDSHFRTRLVKMSYLDTDGKKKPWTATTFVVEDIAEVAKRVNLKPQMLKKADRQQMNLQATATLELFQLLIGNSDYSTLAAPAGDVCCHNARLIAKKGQDRNIVPVPYDFDVSGFVNAPYALPAAQYPIKKVRDRYFTGWCKNEKYVRNAVDLFKQRREKIYQVVEGSNLVSSSRLKSTLKYLDGFYSIINNEKRVKREILGRCRGNMFEG